MERNQNETKNSKLAPENHKRKRDGDAIVESKQGDQNCKHHDNIANLEIVQGDQKRNRDDNTTSQRNPKIGHHGGTIPRSGRPYKESRDDRGKLTIDLEDDREGHMGERTQDWALLAGFFFRAFHPNLILFATLPLEKYRLITHYQSFGAL